VVPALKAHVLILHADGEQRQVRDCDGDLDGNHNRAISRAMRDCWLLKTGA
jgi:hypothetical protein